MLISFPDWFELSLTCIQVIQEAGKNSCLEEFPSLEEFSTICCDPNKGFSGVNEAEIDVFLEFSCFFYDSMNEKRRKRKEQNYSENIWKKLNRDHY